MEIKKTSDEYIITLQNLSLRGSERELWMSIRITDLREAVINQGATGDMTPETALRLANALQVAADISEEDERKHHENQNRIRQQLKQLQFCRDSADTTRVGRRRGANFLSRRIGVGLPG